MPGATGDFQPVGRGLERQRVHQRVQGLGGREDRRDVEALGLVREFVQARGDRGSRWFPFPIIPMTPRCSIGSARHRR